MYGQRIKEDLKRDYQLSDEQASGFAGNLAVESGGFKQLQEIAPVVPGSRGGYGFAQWTGPRRKQFEEWTSQRGMDPKSYEANYGFLRHELDNTNEGRFLGELRSAGSVADASRVVEQRFLRPGIPHSEKRVGASEQIFQGQEPYSRGSARLSGSEQRAGLAGSAPPIRGSGTMFDPSVGTPTLEREGTSQTDARDLPQYKLRDVGSAEQRQVAERGQSADLTTGDTFNFSKSANEYRPQTGWWEGTKIAFGNDNLVAMGWRAATAPEFKSDGEYRPFAQEHVDRVKARGITEPEVIGKIVGKAVSRANLDYLINDEVSYRDDQQKMQDFSATSRFALTAAAVLVDPSVIVPGALAVKGLQGMNAAYRATSTLGRLAEGGLVSLAGSIPNIAGKYAINERYTGTEALIEAGLAVTIGGAFAVKYGAVGRDVIDYARKQTVWGNRQLAQEAGASETAAGKAYFDAELSAGGKNTGEAVQSRSATSAGAAANDALLEEAKALRKTSDYIDVSDAAVISRTGNVEIKAIFDEFIPDPINRATGARTLDFSAWEIGSDIRDRALTTFQTGYQSAFEELKKRDNLSVKAWAQSYGEFGEAVTQYARKPNPDAADPLVRKAAEAMRKADDMIASEIEALKGTRDKNGNLIPWIESFKRVDNHVNRIIDNDTAAAIFNRKGAGYVAEGISKLVKQSGALMEQIRDRASGWAARDAKKEGNLAKGTAEVLAEGPAKATKAGRVAKAKEMAEEADDYADVLKAALDDLEAERTATKQAYATVGRLSREDGRMGRFRSLDMEMATLDKQVAAAKEAHKDALKQVRTISADATQAKKTAGAVARKDIKEAGADAFAEAFAKSYVKRLGQNIDDIADQVGWRYARTIEDVVTRPQSITAVSGTAQEMLVEAARRSGVAVDQVDQMIATLYPAGRTGPSATRRRLAIDDAETVMVRSDNASGLEPFNLGMLLDNNAASIMSKYTQGIVMDIGLAHRGYGSFGQYSKALDDAFINNGLASSYAHKVADRLVKKTYGMGGKDGIEEAIGTTLTNIVKGAQAMATASFGGNFVVGAMFEPANLIKRFGLSVIHDNTHIKDIFNAVRKGGKEADEIYSNLQLYLGIGVQTKSNRVFTRWEGVGDHLDVGRIEQASRIFEKTAKNLATATTTGLGMVPATDMTKLAGARTFLQTLHDLSLGKIVRGPGAMRTRDELLQELGVTDAMLANSKRFFEHFKTDESGLVVGSKAEFDKAVSMAPAEWNTIRLMIRRADRSGIASDAPGVVPWWYDNLAGKTLLQFMTFSFLTHNYATVNDWNVGKTYAVTGLAISLGAGMMQHAVLSYARSLGKSEEDRKKYIEKQFGGIAMLTNGYGRSPTSGLIPTTVDNLVAPFMSVFGMDEAPFSGARLSGIESRSVGISAPVVQLGLGIKGLIDLPSDAIRSDKVVTQQQAKNISSWVPAKSFLPMAVAMDYGFSKLPKQEPVAQTMRNKGKTTERLIQ